MTRIILLVVIAVAILFGLYLMFGTDEAISEMPSQAQPQSSETIQIIAENLEVPWALKFLPDDSIIFTERVGNLKYMAANYNLASAPIAQLPDVVTIGEGGLLGLEIHPDFETNNYIYMYYTYTSGGNTLNKVVRYKLENMELTEDMIILENIPGSANHNGGRLAFGPDGYLYITTGDAGNASLAQDTSSLAGKILRMADDGGIPEDNPFSNAVYSYGHRNPQGLAWDSQRRLWATEHGSSAHDELNLIERGANYGWPDITGDETREGMQAPVIQSGDATWAPTGLAHLNGNLYFAGLRGSALYRYDIEDARLDQFLENAYGRLRAVELGPNNLLYVSTSNRDGRGTPVSSDDRIIVIDPTKF